MKRTLLVEDDLPLDKSLKEAIQLKEYQVQVADCFHNRNSNILSIFF